MNSNVMVQPKDCAVVGCTQPAAAIPLIVDVATLPGPFEIPLCALCREPFDAGIVAVERLLDGDAEALPATRSLAPGSRTGSAATDRAIWLTEGEHQALNLGSLALREVGTALTRSGAGDLAAVSYLSAAVLESLVQRALAEALRVHERPQAEVEAEL